MTLVSGRTASLSPPICEVSHLIQDLEMPRMGTPECLLFGRRR